RTSQIELGLTAVKRPVSDQYDPEGFARRLPLVGQSGAQAVVIRRTRLVAQTDRDRFGAGLRGGGFPEVSRTAELRGVFGLARGADDGQDAGALLGGGRDCAECYEQEGIQFKIPDSRFRIARADQ